MLLKFGSFQNSLFCFSGLQNLLNSVLHYLFFLIILFLCLIKWMLKTTHFVQNEIKILNCFKRQFLRFKILTQIWNIIIFLYSIIPMLLLLYPIKASDFISRRLYKCNKVMKGRSNYFWEEKKLMNRKVMNWNEIYFLYDSSSWKYLHIKVE